MRGRVSRIRFGAGSAICALAMGILGAQAALAQSAQAVDEAGASSDESKDLVVTASRIDRKGFDAPTPATILSADGLSL